MRRSALGLCLVALGACTYPALRVRSGDPDTGPLPDGDTTDAMDAADVPLPDDAGDAEPPGDVVACTLPLESEPIVVPSGMVTTRRGATGARSVNAATSCRTSTEGFDAIYPLHVTATTGVVVTVEPTPNSTDRRTLEPVLAVRRVCDDLATELGCKGTFGLGGATPVGMQLVLEPGDHYIVIDECCPMNPPGGGPYQLTVESFSAAANATCAGAVELMPATTYYDQDASRGGGTPPDATARECRREYSGGQLFYFVDVPPNTLARITVTPTTASMNDNAVVRRFGTSCEMPRCVTTFGNPGARVVVDELNTSVRTERRFLSIGTIAPTVRGVFNVSVELTPVS